MPGDRAVLILLGLFVAAWTSFQVISYAAVDLHPDVLEVFAWGQHPAFGYYKHPPLGGLTAAAWFAVFPVADWSAHLLAMSNGTLALYFVDRIARRYLTGDKRLLVLLLLMMTPFYQFHAVRFASNQTLLSTWPLATYCFIRAFESRGVGWGAAAGASAALAMLGKYFSIYLVGGFVIAALMHPARWRYLRSASPWASVLVGLALLAPHLHWLATTGFRPFGYAVAVHGGVSFATASAASIGYLVGVCGYIVLPVAIWWLAARPRLADFARALWPSDPDRRLLATLLWATLLLPALTAPFLGIRLTSIWAVQGWFLLPMLLLMPDEIVLRRQAAVAVAIVVAAVTVAVLASAPALAWVKHLQGTKEARAYYRPVAAELTRFWHEATPRRLAIVMGDQDFAAAASFYSPDRPDFVPGFDLGAAPWVTPERLARDGFGVICQAVSRGCIAEAERRSAGHPGARRAEVEIVRRLFGVAGEPARFILVIAPPMPPA